MSVIGIDLGSMNTVVAVARNRGVDVVTNEVSNRATPSLVGFGPKARYLGETAKTQEISNLKNTVGSLKRLAGRSFKDAEVQMEQQFVSAPLIDVGGQVGAEVTYRGKKEKFTATQLIAMLLSKIKQTTSNEIRQQVSDVVMSVPAWFSDSQRRSLIDASEIAGLKLLRLINDTTAAALGYGITKLDLPSAEEKPRRVAFVDIGYSNYTVSVVEFRKGELAVKGTAWDRHFGGRNFDKALLDHLQKEFLGKYKIDINTHPRAVSRVLAAAEKVKKILSANQQAPLNIESLMNDIDVSAMITRQEFEAMVEPLLNRVTVPLEQVLADAKLTKDDIDVIEVIGGGTRVPSIKERIQAFFGKPLSFTLNQDEAIARGCAFSCAIMSPVFRVRDFVVHDLISYPIEFAWEKANDIPDEDPNLVVFGKGNVMPSTKVLTFFRKRPFDLEARYYTPEELPGGVQPFIARFSVKGVKPTIGGPDDYMTCKLRARVNVNGVLNIESAYYVEDQEFEEPIKEDETKKEEDAKDAAAGDAAGDKKDPDAMDTDAAKEEAKPKTRKVRKQVRKGELPIVSATQSLDSVAKNVAIEKEVAMVTEDKLVADTEEKKNELETYIYDLRNKLDDQYADFASDDEKQKLREKLEQSEDWLYEDGEDASKGVYIAKMDEIRAMAGPIVQRHFEKTEADRQALQAKLEAEAAAKKAAAEKAAEEEAAKKAAADGAKTEGANDEVMTDADSVQPNAVEEAEER